MRLLGLSYGGYHDSNVTVMENGKVVVAINEERLSGVKKDGRFPKNSISGLDMTGIETVCVPYLRDRESLIEFEKAHISPSDELMSLRQNVYGQISNFTKKFENVKYYSHQDCHAASAYYFSGFENALVVTWDAGSMSEPWNFTVQIGKGLKLKRVEESTDGTPALNYAAITALCGFRPERHEGKITGLSASGDVIASELEKIKMLLNRYDSSTSLLQQISKWQNAGSELEVPILKVNDESVKDILSTLKIERKNLAALIQHLTEEKVLAEIKRVKDTYPDQMNICLAGGIFANVTINRKIKELGFENIYVHSAMGDDGLSLGACAIYSASKGVRPYIEDNVFWGPGYSNNEIKSALEASGLEHYRAEDIAKEIAVKLSNGEIVARFDGRMEYGPRSLGNRSILADASSKHINQTLNQRLNRTEFMPFAPITLDEDMPLMYENFKGMRRCLKFMTIAVKCSEQCIKENPAVCHIDNTARPQMVGDENPRLQSVLRAYKEITGKKVLINTSFNMHEGPIVCSPTDALDTFKKSKLDCLAIGDFIVLQEN